MAADEPPYLTVGTDVSAKYKGAFCEAKIKKVNRVVKCKVTFNNNQGSLMLPDDQIRGSLRIGGLVEARHPEKNQYLDAVINKMQDYSQYTVVFNDGDETTLRRTSLCLKSGPHFAESPTLDQFPLTNPEHFSTPVIGVVKSKRKRRSTYNSAALDYSSSDEELIPKKTKSPRNREKDRDIGKVVCVEYGDRRKKDCWYPGLVVMANSSQDTFKINTKEDYLIRSFKDGKYYQVPKKDTKDFSRDISRRVESNTLKTAVEKALQYCEKGELPPHWDKTLYLGLETASGDDDIHDTDSDTSDDEPSEEKDRFVAQLYKFMDERGTPINKAPSVGNKDVNLYKLFIVVHKMGGYNRVTNQNKWKIVCTKMGIQSNPSLSNQLKLAHKRYLHSFEDFYRKLGCTMVTNSRSTRGRHRSDRNFMLTRNAVCAKIKSRGKEKSLEKKVEEKPSSAEKKESKMKAESPKSEEKAKKKSDKPKVEEKESKGKMKKEEDKPRLVRSQSLNKEKQDFEKKDTRTDRARAREESKKEKTESPEKKKETRSSAKIEQEREKRERSSSENKATEVKEAKERSPREKKEEKTVKETKTAERKEEKEKKGERPGRERQAKEDKGKVKNEEKPPSEKKDKSEERKAEKAQTESPKHESKLMRERREKQNLVLKCEKDEVEVKLEKEDLPDTKCLLLEKDTTKVSKEKEMEKEDSKEKQQRKSLRHEDGLMLTEVKIEKLEDVDTETSTSQSSRSNPSQDDEDMNKEILGKRLRGNEERDDIKSLIDLSDSDDEDDPSESEKSDKEAKEKQIEIGDKVKVKYGRGRTRKVYEAKVLKVDSNSAEKRYYVHYAGWNTRYDEWVRRSFIVENITEQGKLSRQRRQDLFCKGTLSFVKKTNSSRPPGFSPAAKLTRKNSTSSTTSVSSSRTTRSDKNNSLHTSPFSKGLQPKRRVRRKSGISVALTDTSQDSESDDDDDDDDMIYLYPEGETNDEDDDEQESDTPNKSGNAKDGVYSDQEMYKDTTESYDRDEEDNSSGRITLRPGPACEKFKDVMNKNFEPVVSLVRDEIKEFKDCESIKASDFNVDKRVLPSSSTSKANVPELKLCDKKKTPIVGSVHKPGPRFGETASTSSDHKIATVSITHISDSSILKSISLTKPCEVAVTNDEHVLRMFRDMQPLTIESPKVEKKGNDDRAPPVVEQMSAPVDTKDKDEKMPTLQTCVEVKPVVKADISLAKDTTFESKVVVESSPMKTKKEIFTKSEDKPKFVTGKLNTLLDGKPRERSVTPNVVQHVGLFGDINFSPRADSLSKCSLSPRPAKKPHVLPDSSIIKVPITEIKIEKPQIPQIIAKVVEEKIVAKPLPVLPEVVKEKRIDTCPKVDIKEKPDVAQVPADTGARLVKEKTSLFGKLCMATPDINDVTTIKSPLKPEKEIEKTITPSKAPEPEPKISYSAFPIHKYFMDLKASAITQAAISTPKPIKKDEIPPAPVCNIVEETKAAEKQDAEDSPVDIKSNTFDEISTTEIKEAGLQTSVITFVSSSSTSTTSTTDMSDDKKSDILKEVKSPAFLSNSENTNDYEVSQAIEGLLVEETKPSSFSEKLSPSLKLCPSLLPDEPSSTSSDDSSDEDKKNDSLSSTLDDNIHESLTELSIDDEGKRDGERPDRNFALSSTCISNVFSNVYADKSLTDVKELFSAKKCLPETPISFGLKKEDDNIMDQNLSTFPEATTSDVVDSDKVSSLKESEDNGSSSSAPSSKKEGKKKKSKISKQDKKMYGLDPLKKDDMKMKDSKGKSKKRKLLDGDELSRGKDSEQKTKSKKLKKNKNKKRFSRHDDHSLELGEGDDDFSERLKRKEKRKRDEKKFSKFDLKSEGTSESKGERLKKERKKGRKNKLGSDRRSELGERKAKEKRKNYAEDNNGDSDSEKETLIRLNEKKKRKERKKMKAKDAYSGEASESNLMIEETRMFPETEDKNEDPDMSFLLCEEKVPASPVTILPEDTTASSSIDESNNVSPSSDEEQAPVENLELYPRSGLAMLAGVGNSAEACAMLVNTPPTTPSSTESIPSSSPSHDREPFVHYTESTQSGRDSGDNESDGFPCSSSHADVCGSEEYNAAATLAFVVCKSIPIEKPRDCTRVVPVKRQKSESEEYSPCKRRRKTKRSFGLPDASPKPSQPRVRGLSGYSKDFESPNYPISSPPHSHTPAIFSSFTHSSNQPASVSTDTSSAAALKSGKVNFFMPLHEYKDPEKRITILQDKMSELRKLYASLKAEVATIDRRRKKARKKMREAAGSNANNSSTQSEDGQNCS